MQQTRRRVAPETMDNTGWVFIYWRPCSLARSAGSNVEVSRKTSFDTSRDPLRNVTHKQLSDLMKDISQTLVHLRSMSHRQVIQIFMTWEEIRDPAGNPHERKENRKCTGSNLRSLEILTYSQREYLHNRACEQPDHLASWAAGVDASALTDCVGHFLERPKWTGSSLLRL